MTQYKTLEKELKAFSDNLAQIKLDARISYSNDQARLLEIAKTIPKDPQLFYEDFGLLTHPLTGKPVPKLGIHQYEFWKAGWLYRYREAVKSNKIGLTTTSLMELFQHAILDCAGYEMLIFAQTHDMAKDKLKRLRAMVGASDKYRQFMVTHARDYLLKDDVTKVTEVVIENPYNPYKPTFVKALSGSAGSSVSWMNVKWVYFTDITMSSRDYSETMSGGYSRLANTQGYYVVETIPNGPVGEVYRIWKDSRIPQEEEDNPELAAEPGRFWVREYPVIYGVQAGIIDPVWLEAEKKRQGSRYAQKYECSFQVTGGTVFSQAMLDDARILGRQYRDQLARFSRTTLPKSMGIDTGFGSSNFAITCTVKLDGKVFVFHSSQEERASFLEMIEDIVGLVHRYYITKIFIDASDPEFIDALRRRLKLPLQYDKLTATEFSELNDFGRVVPLNTGSWKVQSLSHMKRISEDGMLGVDDEAHPLLYTEMGQAEEKNHRLDKSSQEYDGLESLSYALLNYLYTDEEQA